MTLCKFRPQRTYDYQFIIDRHDARGLLKVLDQVVNEMGEAGLVSTSVYAGVLLGLSTLFDMAEDKGEVDKWTDFMRELDKNYEKLEGSE